MGGRRARRILASSITGNAAWLRAKAFGLHEDTPGDLAPSYPVIRNCFLLFFATCNFWEADCFVGGVGPKAGVGVFFLDCIYNGTQMYAWMGLELVWGKYQVRMNSIALSVEKSAENRCTRCSWPRVATWVLLLRSRPLTSHDMTHKVTVTQNRFPEHSSPSLRGRWKLRAAGFSLVGHSLRREGADGLT